MNASRIRTPSTKVPFVLPRSSRRRSPPSTRSLVEEAKRRNIPTLRLNDQSLVQLGWGVHQQRIQATLYHHGCPARRSLMTGDGRAWLAAQPLGESAREQVTIALALIDALETQLVPLDRELRAYARRLPGFGGSSNAHLWKNFLRTPATVWSDHDIVRVTLVAPRLDVIWRISGAGRAAYRLPDDRAVSVDVRR